MSVSERIPFHVELSRIIDLLAKQIYQSPLALLRENCQNAYDAILQRRYVDSSFQPEIKINVTPTEISVIDNGIGMTKEELQEHYWKAGSSGKNNPEARAAGVVGTFGIGAMANFGIADQLTVITESAKDGRRTRCRAIRETLSATEDCIEIFDESPTGQPGTIVIASIQPQSPVDVNAAINYISEFTRFLDVPVTVNGNLVSKQAFENYVQKLPVAASNGGLQEAIGPQVKADIELVIAKTGEVWLSLNNIYLSGSNIEGNIILRQGMHQIRTYRSRFALATAAVSSLYGFGGIANLKVFEPTAGREALTTESLQILQVIITEVEKYVSEKIAATPFSDSNTNFMQWVTQHSRYELCSNLKIRVEPDNRSMSLGTVKDISQNEPFNYFTGSDPALINQYATEEKSLLVIASSQPRRNCELTYLQRFCKVNQIQDAPSVLSRKNERDWSFAESAFVLRVVGILDSDYFVKASVGFGKISHGLPIHIETATKPIEIIIDSDAATIQVILTLHREDPAVFTGMIKDFVRNIIFPRISNLVPSSTREGAEAFLKAIRRPREVFEYERADLGKFSEIWQDYLEGKISLDDAAKRSTAIVQANVQVVDRSAAASASNVIPDVIENQQQLETAENVNEQKLDPLPAITRLDKESNVKLITIEDNETPLQGYRCFLALIDRVREEYVDFFLQPHRTEVVWGGQKALFIFQHHSGQFGLYYELQGNEILSDASGGGAFQTCTIVLKNQIYIPVPDAIRHRFIPQADARKRFEIRCELLYPDFG